MTKIGTFTILVVFLTLFFFWSFSTNSRVEKNKPVNILENSLVTWHKGWKKEQGFYRSLISGAEVDFSFDNSQKIRFNLETSYTNPAVGLEGWLDKKYFVFSFPELSSEKTILTTSPKKHILKARAFCFTVPPVPCDLKIHSITLDQQATVLPSNRQKGTTLAVLGDSITGTYGNQNYTFLLANRLNFHLLNSSYGGATMTNSGLERVKSEIIPYQPDVLVIALGSNDLGNNIPLSDFTENYDKVVKLIKKSLPKTQIITLGLLHREDFSNYQLNAYSQAVKNISQGQNINYIDPSGWLNEQDLTDGIHPTLAAQSKLAEKMVKSLGSIVDIKK